MPSCSHAHLECIQMTILAGASSASLGELCWSYRCRSLQSNAEVYIAAPKKSKAVQAARTFSACSYLLADGGVVNCVCACLACDSTVGTENEIC
eukprot:6214080-Pleurochrysis_carterae.AAC.4